MTMDKEDIMREMRRIDASRSAGILTRDEYEERLTQCYDMMYALNTDKHETIKKGKTVNAFQLLEDTIRQIVREELERRDRLAWAGQYPFTPYNTCGGEVSAATRATPERCPVYADGYHRGRGSTGKCDCELTQEEARALIRAIDHEELAHTPPVR